MSVKAFETHPLELVLENWYHSCGTILYNGIIIANRYVREYLMKTDRIEINPQVMLGKPVIRGTRIPVELIVRKLSEGATETDLLDAYPRLTEADIKAALAFAADSLAHETIVFQPV